MQVSFTEPSVDSNGSTGRLNFIIATCSSTISSTDAGDDDWQSFYTSFKTEQLITLWILFVVIMVGNSVVLYLTWKERVRKRKSRMTFFVTQLAITDALTGLISILTDIIWRFTGDFLAPDIVCRVIRYLQGILLQHLLDTNIFNAHIFSHLVIVFFGLPTYLPPINQLVVLLYASTYVLVSLSIDRYHAIVHPMKFLQGERQAKVLIVVAWTLSFLFSIPTLIIFGKYKLANGEIQCWALWPDESYWKPYMTIVSFLVYFIPLIIISVIYFIVIRTIWSKSKSHAVIISNCTDGKFSASYSHRGLISKAKMKAIKYSLVVILAFILCWSPYFLFDILDNYELLPMTKERIYASVIIQNLPVLNSAVNPIIYCVFSNKHCRLSRDRSSGQLAGTLRDKTEGVEMQVVSRPEYI
ncbi:neuropeptide S receptor isoform X1 [Ranitomeya variabilis]|uniref:neuropeptide S receptor isoform X1 n=1 Tax=Ranitomeya variabilis TaxID=490064 RepID=UPI0040567B3B